MRRTATPPVILPILFCIFSLSQFEVAVFSWLLRRLTRSSIADESPSPPTNVVLFFPRITFSAPPNDIGPCALTSALRSLARTWAPVRIAISSKISPCSSPNPGALIAAALTILLATLRTKVANASPSISLAIINNGRFCCMLASRLGNKS